MAAETTQQTWWLSQKLEYFVKISYQIKNNNKKLSVFGKTNT